MIFPVTSSCFCIPVRISCTRRRTACTPPSCRPSSRTPLRMPRTCRRTCCTSALRTRFPCTSSWMPSCTCRRSPCTSSCTFPSSQPSGCLTWSCIRCSRPHRPSCTRCSFRCSQRYCWFFNMEVVVLFIWFSVPRKLFKFI